MEIEKNDSLINIKSSDNFSNNNNYRTYSPKKARAFRNIYFGVRKSRKLKKPLRFLTLTTSDIQKYQQSYDIKKTLPNDFRALKARIKRCSPYRLFKEGYLTHRQMIHYYGRNNLNKKFTFEYLKVNTNEGNGVIHAIYRGSYLPYNYLVDNWQDIHNSWEINIQRIDDLKKSDKNVASYIVNQYITNQDKATYTRYSQSKQWIFPNYSVLWSNMKRSFKPPELYNYWDKIIYEKSYFQKTLLDDT